MQLVKAEWFVLMRYLSQGYHRAHAQTELSFQDGGWFATGDVGEFDAQTGTYTVLERVSAVASLKSGALVYPSKLEVRRVVFV